MSPFAALEHPPCRKGHSTVGLVVESTACGGFRGSSVLTPRYSATMIGIFSDYIDDVDILLTLKAVDLE